MVKIEETEDDEDILPNPNPPSMEPQPDSPDTVSSISSDHTFHGFSPLKDNTTNTLPSPSSIQLHEPSPSPVLVPMTNRFVRDQPESMTKTEPDAEPGFAEDGRRTRQKDQYRTKGLLTRARYGKILMRAGLGLRVFEFVVCLVSFSVLASDKRRGWALDSFDRYVEFRYSMAVNVIGFAYSAIQGIDLLHQLTRGKDLLQSQIRYCFDFGIDQILAYLLLSASSSAFTRVDDWISNWGQDKFPAMASASVGVSFLAFVAFALSSLISGYILCTDRFA